MEIKSVEALAQIHKKQLSTYLRLADKRLGFTDELQRSAHQGRNPQSRQRTGQRKIILYSLRLGVFA
jgi:hypothetical protein